MAYSLSAASQIIDCTSLVLAFWFINKRLKESGFSGTISIQHLKKFFMYFATFLIIMTLPHIFLYFNQDSFPQAMAIGYTIGHIFLFIAMVYISRMTFTIVPSLVKFEKYVIYLGILLNVVVTFLETKLMVFGPYKPFYDDEWHITNLNVPAVVGAAIAISFAAAVLPPAILFIISAFKSSGAKRARALLLAAGLITLMLSGPLHDNARSWQVFLVADIFTVVGNMLLAVGIAYKLEHTVSVKSRVAGAQLTT